MGQNSHSQGLQGWESLNSERGFVYKLGRQGSLGQITQKQASAMAPAISNSRPRCLRLCAQEKRVDFFKFELQEYKKGYSVSRRLKSTLHSVRASRECCQWGPARGHQQSPSLPTRLLSPRGKHAFFQQAPRRWGVHTGGHWPTTACTPVHTGT